VPTGASNAVHSFGSLSTSDGTTYTERARIDASGNLGLGVTPSAWAAQWKALQIGQGYTALVGRSDAIATYYGSNWLHDGSDKYIANGHASIYTQQSGQHIWLTAPSGTAGAAITFGDPKMTLDASGNLGIGTTSPQARVDVRPAQRSTAFNAADTSTWADVLTFNTSSAANSASGIAFQTSGGGFNSNQGIGIAAVKSSASDSDASLVFITRPSAASSAERARITSGGYFKASNDGTYDSSTGSYHELRQSGDGFFTTVMSHKSANANAQYGLNIKFSAASPDNNTVNFLQCEDSTAVRCYIWSDGDLANHDGVYGTISDERLKQDITDASSQWNDLKAVRFRKYRMKTDVAADANAPYQLGVIAQELAQTSPGLVDEHPNDDGTTTKTVKSSILLMKAAVALQEAMTRIETLEQRVMALEA
jgi:hypothetical protein